MSKKTLSTIIQLIVFLGIAFGLIYWRFNVMKVTERTAMFEAMHHVRWIYLIPILIIAFFSHYFRSLRWKQLMEPLSIFPTTANTLFAVLLGYFFNTFIPRLGEVAKCTALAKYEEVPADKLVGTIIAERAFDLVSLIAIVLLTLAVQYDVIYPFALDTYHKMFFDANGHFIWLRILLALGIITAGMLTLILLYRKIKDSKIGHIIKGIAEGLRAIALVKNKWKFILYTILIWTCYVATASVGFLALPETEHVPMLAGLSVISFGSIAMIVTPGGVGAFPVIIAQVLLLYGLNEGIGSAYGWVSWATQTFIVIILGLISLVLLPIYNRTKHATQI